MVNQVLALSISKCKSTMLVDVTELAQDNFILTDDTSPALTRTAIAQDYLL